MVIYEYNAMVMNINVKTSLHSFMSLMISHKKFLRSQIFNFRK